MNFRNLAWLFFFPLSLFSQGYFQQRVNYTINVTLNDRKHELSGFESIEYHNHSDQTLDFIYFHLWPNAYRDNNTAFAKQLLQQGRRDFYFAKDSERGFIDSLDFRTNGTPLKKETDKENSDICKIYLTEPLKPGDVVTITTPFRVKIPDCRFSRLGHDYQAYYVSQWYPKPAVFDASGWNPMPYLDQGEFYSEFGKYDVSITLPKNYVLSATGERYDSEEEENFLNQKIMETEEIVKKVNAGKYVKDVSFPESDKEYKTVRFRQDNVHDFAWFADKRFRVLRGDLILPHSKRNVYTWSFFTDNQIELWKDALNYISDATFYYSLWNGDYLYNHVSAVDGTISAGSGMEYPMVTIISPPSSAFELDQIITHEVGHNWFYGMLGSNERLHAWMDEGINSFNEMRYIRTKYPKATLADMLGRDSSFRWLRLNKYRQAYAYYALYAFEAKQNSDQPCETPSADFTEGNYAAIVYSKTAVLFNYLMNYMGEGDFDVAMQFYFEQCKLKHPTPTDLRKALEYFSEKKLDWFFDDLICTNNKLEYKVEHSSRENDGSYLVEVKNKGNIKGPVALCGTRNGKIIGMVWYEGFDGSKVLEFPPAEVDAFKIDYFGFMPEVNRHNNILRTKGIFKKVEPLKVHFVAALDDPDKTQIFLAPAVGYNMYNSLMIGGAYYNHSVFEKKFETELLPMYATGNNTLAGMGAMRLNFRPNKFFSKVKLEVKASRFAYEQNVFTNNYNKISPLLGLEFKKKRPTSEWSHKLGYRYVQICRQITSYELNHSDSTYKPVQKNSSYGVHDILWQTERENALYPFSAKVNFQTGNDVQKVSVTLVQKLFVSRSRYFEVRAFAGKMLYMNSASPVDYRFRTSGWIGSNDYLYDYLYLGRTEPYGLSANQFTEVDGAFKIYTPLGQTADWIASVNIKSPRLFKLPLLVYADFGTCAKDGLAGYNSFMCDAGLDIILSRDICEIFVPLYISKNIQTVNNLSPYGVDFLHQIRFTLNLYKLNPFSILRQSIPL